MRKLYLYGGRADNFIETAAPFVAAAGGPNARIALLFPTSAEGWDRNLAWYCEPFQQLGARQVTPVRPDRETGALTAEALDQIRSATGIFMCGGDTRLYHQVYTAAPARAALREAYQKGIPYAGLSAGALIAPETGSVWGDTLTTATNTAILGGSEDGCEAELQLGDGLGFLHGLIIECHFAEEGGFPRLITAMEQAEMPFGVGFDNPVCLEIEDERNVRIHGQGRVYLVWRRGGMRFETQVLEPGATFLLP